MRSDKIEEKIEIPGGVNIELVGSTVDVKGEKGELQRTFKSKKVKIARKDNTIIVSAEKPSKREKTMIGTFKSHIKNMIKGVKEGFVYKLKVCFSHFPITVSVDGKKVLIKNLFGEKVPRVAKILDGVDVKVENDTVVVEGIDKEAVGQTAANIERACKITKRDRRIFLDGIWMTSKGGKEIE